MKIKLAFQAWGDLLKRYRAVFSHAWSVRDSFKGPGFNRHEAAFLPAALALQETPVSPAPRVAMWLLMTFAFLAVTWAAFGQMDIVATGQGRVVPNDRVKTIQPFERATVTAIHVSDGQAVKAGQVLIELDATTTLADKERVASDLASARLQVERAQALQQALDTGKLPPLPKLANVSDSLWRDSQRLLDSQFNEYNSKIARLQAAITEHEAARQSIQVAIRKLEETVPIARQRAEDYKNLVSQNFVSRHGYLEREQARIEQESDLAAQRSKLLELEASLQSARLAKSAQATETRRMTLDSRNDAAQKVAALEQELLKANSRNQQNALIAPVDGTVQQLTVHTVGGVVTEAEKLMVIVPKDNPVEIEAILENKDIGFVRAGQEAEVKIETFQYTRYGTLHAKVLSVSDDAINDEKRGLVYTARVKTDQSTLHVEGKEVRLSPGMAVSVEVKTGKRRVIEYFLSPLLRYRDESLRER